MTNKTKPLAPKYNVCELTEGSTIQIDEWTTQTHLDNEGNLTLYNGPETTVTTKFTSGVFKDVRESIVCKVRQIHVVVSVDSISYIVETDLKYNEREQELFKQVYHCFALAYVSKILKRENKPVKYKLFRIKFPHSNTVPEMLFSICPHHVFVVPKVIEYCHKHNMFVPVKGWPRRGLIDYTVPRNKKKFKEFLKRNINRFKAFKFNAVYDDTHGYESIYD